MSRHGSGTVSARLVTPMAPRPGDVSTSGCPAHAEAAARCPVARPAALIGFRHFMPDAKACDRHRRRPAEPEHLRRLMKGLAWRMDHAFAWPDHAAETVQR